MRIEAPIPQKGGPRIGAVHKLCQQPKGGGGGGKRGKRGEKGGGGGLEPRPPFLADIICEQPLIGGASAGEGLRPQPAQQACFYSKSLYLELLTTLLVGVSDGY